MLGADFVNDSGGHRYKKRIAATVYTVAAFVYARGMETFNVGDRVIFRPSPEEPMEATVTEVFATAATQPFGGAYGILLDEPWDENAGMRETAAHGMELTKNA